MGTHTMDLSFSPAISDGQYTLAVRVTDQVDLTSTGYSGSVLTVDTSAPSLTGSVVNVLALGDSVEVGFSNQQGVACASFAVADAGSGVSRWVLHRLHRLHSVRRVSLTR
jgi:hypothetical protein